VHARGLHGNWRTLLHGNASTEGGHRCDGMSSVSEVTQTEAGATLLFAIPPWGANWATVRGQQACPPFWASALVAVAQSVYNPASL
jgi:hypothetical protein